MSISVETYRARIDLYFNRQRKAKFINIGSDNLGLKVTGLSWIFLLSCCLLAISLNLEAAKVVYKFIHHTLQSI